MKRDNYIVRWGYVIAILFVLFFAMLFYVESHAKQDDNWDRERLMKIPSVKKAVDAAKDYGLLVGKLPPKERHQAILYFCESLCEIAKKKDCTANCLGEALKGEM